jgi:predicted nucleotide-binding protein (sugar kinase/HSP70/actin superfamily)
MCYPAICSLGQLLYALECGDYDPHKVALMQFQTGGGCRASNYIWLLRKALKNMGMDYVPVLSMSFGKMEKSGAFKITPLMILKGIMAVMYGDMIMLLRNQIMPYEINKGSVKALVEHWNSVLTEQFRHNKGLIGKGIRKNLENMVRDFHDIPIKRVKKSKVGIVGEIYVKYSQFGNNRLEDFLTSENCEFMVPGVLGFIQYCFSDSKIDRRYYGGSYGKVLISKIVSRRVDMLEKYMLDALKPYPDIVAPAPFKETEKLADKVCIGSTTRL